MKLSFSHNNHCHPTTDQARKPEDPEEEEEKGIFEIIIIDEGQLKRANILTPSTKR